MTSENTLYPVPKPSNSTQQSQMICLSNIKSEMHLWAGLKAVALYVNPPVRCPLGFAVGFGTECCDDLLLSGAWGQISQNLWGAASHLLD